MTGGEPLLALPAPETGVRFRQSPNPGTRISSIGAARQGQRLSPQFNALAKAFESKRAQLADGHVEEVDPELVLVFDLAGTVENFYNAVNKVEGLEFLAEMIEDAAEPDDDFHILDEQGRRTDRAVQRSLYLVMSNAEAARQLVGLFELWQGDKKIKFAQGLNKFKSVFGQLRNIRRWSASDRVRDTGLLEHWQEHLIVVGQSANSVGVEIELWYRSRTAQREAAESHLREVIAAAGGQIKDNVIINEIGYHALLVHLPIQQVSTVLEQGIDSIQLLAADEVMFVSPHKPMSVAPASSVAVQSPQPAGATPTGLPRIALLDGLPFSNHELLAGRLIIDDPDDVGSHYPLSSRHHGTAMASLIIHGDLSAQEQALKRPLYVRPIMRPHDVIAGREQVLSDKLLPDLLHRSIRRMIEGENGHGATAPSVRIVNLSIGSDSRALVRNMSPTGRVLDWLAVKYNLLFVVSAGNHIDPIPIPASAAADAATAAKAALAHIHSTSRMRGILPPGDALNALTVGAVHNDGTGDIEPSDSVWELTELGAPALYSATGPGIKRSIKPDLYHVGGRSLYLKPILNGQQIAELQLAQATALGPGTKVAAPGRAGATDSAAYTFGTSNATALVSREASAAFDLLEAGASESDDFPFPDAQFHPVLVKALLVHASEWGPQRDRLRQALQLDPKKARRELAVLLGYGAIDPARLATATINRAVMITAGRIGREERHTYRVPMPLSLHAKPEWHRVTATLASLAPASGRLVKYRAAKVFFERPDEVIVGGRGTEVDHTAVRRGSCQHEIFENEKAMAFGAGASLPIHVECMDDARRLRKDEDKIRYGLVVSVEAAIETSTTIHDEVRIQLKAQARAQIRPRIQS